jgi:hypothetical protein
MSSANNGLQSGTHVLDRSLYDDENIVDRLYQPPNVRTLRRETVQGQTTHATHIKNTQAYSAVLKKERRDEAAVRRLEREMDALTDPQLLHNAQRDQDSRPASL